MLQCSAMNVNTQPITVSLIDPYGFGKEERENNRPALAAYWYADKGDMIDYLMGYLAYHTAQDAQRQAAMMLLEQLTVPQDDCNSYDEWRFGL